MSMSMVRTGRSRSGGTAARMPARGAKRRDAHARSVDAFGDHRISGVGRGDDHVVGLGIADLELVDLDRPHVDPVGRDHGHPQARDAHVEDGLRGGVDDPQAHPLARA